MDKERKQAWEETLALWEVLKDTPSQELKISGKVSSGKVIFGFKNDILEKLGFKRHRNGCPFCSIYYRTPDCPFGDCSVSMYCVHSPYGAWEKKAHNHVRAKLFYEYLLELYQKEVSKDEIE